MIDSDDFLCQCMADPPDENGEGGCEAGGHPSGMECERPAIHILRDVDGNFMMLTCRECGD